MHKTGLIILIVISAVLVGLFALWLTFNVNDYRATIESQLENRLGRDVTLGRMELALFPPHIQVGDVVVADDPGFANPRPFIRAEQLGVSAKLLPSLKGRS